MFSFSHAYQSELWYSLLWLLNFDCIRILNQNKSRLWNWVYLDKKRSFSKGFHFILAFRFQWLVETKSWWVLSIMFKKLLVVLGQSYTAMSTRIDERDCDLTRGAADSDKKLSYSWEKWLREFVHLSGFLLMVPLSVWVGFRRVVKNFVLICVNIFKSIFNSCYYY